MNNKNTVRIAFGIVIISLLLAIIIAAGLAALSKYAFPDIDSTDLTLLSMLISTVFIGIPVIFYLRFTGKSLRKHLRVNAISPNTLISIIVLSIGFIILVDELDRIVYTFFGLPDFLEELVEQLKITSFKNGLLIFVATALVAPIVEEMLFRGYLQKVLEDSWKDITKAILVTSIFFAMIHLNPYWIVQIYLLGLVLGYLAWRTNSIIPSIILHGLNNGFAVFLNNASEKFNHYYNWHAHVHPLWIITAIILIIIGLKMLTNELELQS